MRVYNPRRLGHSGFYVEMSRSKGLDIASTTAPQWGYSKVNLNEDGYLYLANYYAVITPVPWAKLHS